MWWESIYKESGDISSECQIFGTIPKYIYIHSLYRYILYGCEWASYKNRNTLTRYHQRYIEEHVIRALLSLDCSTPVSRRVLNYLTRSNNPYQAYRKFTEQQSVVSDGTQNRQRWHTECQISTLRYECDETYEILYHEVWWKLSNRTTTIITTL